MSLQWNLQFTVSSQWNPYSTVSCQWNLQSTMSKRWDSPSTVQRASNEIICEQPIRFKIYIEQPMGFVLCSEQPMKIKFYNGNYLINSDPSVRFMWWLWFISSQPMRIIEPYNIYVPCFTQPMRIIETNDRNVLCFTQPTRIIETCDINIPCFTPPMSIKRLHLTQPMINLHFEWTPIRATLGNNLKHTVYFAKRSVQCNRWVEISMSIKVRPHF